MSDSHLSPRAGRRPSELHKNDAAPVPQYLLHAGVPQRQVDLFRGGDRVSRCNLDPFERPEQIRREFLKCSALPDDEIEGRVGVRYRGRLNIPCVDAGNQILYSTSEIAALRQGRRL